MGDFHATAFAVTAERLGEVLGADVIAYVCEHATDTAPSARQREGTPCNVKPSEN